MDPGRDGERGEMRRLVRCFQEDFIKNSPYVVLDGGIRVIEISRIVGTVDKCGELDENFRYIKRKDNVERSRWMRLEHAAAGYTFLPPIDVYMYRGVYYVVDGNRRVAVAKVMKMEYIDANVKEYIHRSEEGALSGAMLRRRFELETGLKSISLTHEIGYRTLLDEVMKYPGTEMSEKRKGWYSEVFLPACSLIESSELSPLYPGLTGGDIFVLIARFFNDFMGGMPQEDFRTIISAFMFSHTLPERRIWRKFPFRFLGRLMSGEERSLDFQR
jgi:hypothetical protein